MYTKEDDYVEDIISFCFNNFEVIKKKIDKQESELTVHFILDKP